MTAIGSVAEASEIAVKSPPAYAVLDLRLEDGSGLSVVEALSKHRADCRVVMLTGYGAIATAVAAVKAGAIDYLAKPADPEDIVKALLAAPDDRPRSRRKILCPPTASAGSTFSASMNSADCVSETARRLNMHRRTLQRILAKRAPR